MRKLLLLTMVVLGFPIIAGAASIDSMGGLKWGANIEEFSNLKDPPPIPFDMGKDSIEERFTLSGIGDNERFGRRQYMIGNTSYEAQYMFYKNRFCQFSISFYGYDVIAGNVENIRQTLITKYGKPTRTKPLVLRVNPNARAGSEYTWIIEKVTIFLHVNDVKNEGFLLYVYEPISKLKDADDKKKNREMEKDL
jgi:hypothetical protein